MANNFQIVISAVDRATATVRKVNQSMERLIRPISQIRRSMSSLGRELGLDKIGRSLVKVGKYSKDVAGKVGSIIAPMAAIAGVGSIAGIASLATEWARLGFEVSRTAMTIGISTSTLQSLRGAAQMAGVSSEDLTGGLKSLGDTMQDALYGRNQQALVMMNRLGIGIHRTANGTVDTTRAFMDLSRAISKIHNPQVQGLIARSFGMEAVLPLLRKGPEAIEAYQKKIAELGGVQSIAAIDAAEQLGIKMNLLHAAVGGVRNEIGAKLMPILTPFIDRLTEWLSKNRDLIATRVGEFVEAFAKWLERVDFNKILNGITDMISGIKSVVDMVGGWKNAIIGLVILMNGSLIASILNLGISLTGLALKSIPAAVGGLGLMKSAMAGTALEASTLLGFLGKIGAVLGTIAVVDQVLSAIDPKDKAGSWIDQNIPGAAWLDNQASRIGMGRSYEDQAKAADQPIGIRQNNPLNLRSWAGAGSANGFALFRSPTEGIAAATKNLQGYGRKGINTVSGIVNRWAPSSDGNNVSAYIADLSKQTGYSANQPLDLNDSKTLAPLISAMIKHENGSNPYSPEMISQAVTAAVGNQKQQVDIHVHGLPAGAKVTAKSSTDNHSVRVGYSMMPASA